MPIRSSGGQNGNWLPGGATIGPLVKQARALEDGVFNFKPFRWALYTGLLAIGLLRNAAADDLLPILGRNAPQAGDMRQDDAKPATNDSYAESTATRPMSAPRAKHTSYSPPPTMDAMPSYNTGSRISASAPARKTTGSSVVRRRSTRVGSVDQVSGQMPTLASEGSDTVDEAAPSETTTVDNTPSGEMVEDGFDPAYGHEGDGMMPVLSSGSWFRNSCWYGEFDFVVYRRSREFGQVVAQDFSLEQTVQIATQDVPLDLAAGGRVTIGTFVGRDLENRDHSYEFTYIGMGQFSGETGITSLAPQNVSIPNQQNLNGFQNADSIVEKFTSQIASYELNAKIHRRLSPDNMVMAPDGSWTRQADEGYLGAFLFGVRAFTVDETYTLTGRRTGVSPSVFGGDFNIQSDNSLLGLQGGGEFYDQHTDWYWGMRGKMGAFANFSNTHVTANFVGTPAQGLLASPARDYRADSQTPSFMMEFSLMAGYHITPNFVLKTSYDMLWLAKFASAPDQLAFQPPPAPEVFDVGSAFIQGLSVGFEYYW